MRSRERCVVVLLLMTLITLAGCAKINCDGTYVAYKRCEVELAHCRDHANNLFKLLP